MVLFLIFVLDSLIRGHDLPTSRRATRALVKMIKQHKPDAKNFYDVGCAHGSLSLAVKKALPYLEIYAVDNSAIRIFFAKLSAKILGLKINFSKHDIFDTDLRSADIVYTYLWYDVMPPLEKKLQNELRHGAIVVTNTSNFPTWQPTQRVVTYPKVSKLPNFETLFVYVKK
jgi:2-polyprenyl-3-methyl-5-hydroxy-6-metoxy-1,4-benzoquinol methylase